MITFDQMEPGQLTELAKEVLRARDGWVIRLHLQGNSQQAIADEAHLSRCAIQNIIRREREI